MANKWFETVAEAQRRAKKRLPKSVYGALIAGSSAVSRSRTTSPPLASWASPPTSPAWPRAGT